MSLKLCVIPGDGVGSEVIPCAVEALRRVAPDLETIGADAGWECFTRVGNAFPESTRAAIAACGAALFGATSSPSRKVEGYRSPILQMRQAFDLYANLRPTRDVGLRVAGSGVGAELRGVAPADLLIVRENTEGCMSNGNTSVARLPSGYRGRFTRLGGSSMPPAARRSPSCAGQHFAPNRRRLSGCGRAEAAASRRSQSRNCRHGALQVARVPSSLT
jgi:homoisocitrate dehydrogenase